MQQRRLRLGDVLDDYCPRERRITNHAVVAMIEDDVKQTRCTTCDTEHEYKQARMPTLRRKKDVVAQAYKEVLAEMPVDPSAPLTRTAGPAPEGKEASPPLADAPLQPVAEERPAAKAPQTPEPVESPSADAAPEPGETGVGRVHRRLIRATLPRTDNVPPARPIPEFTMHQPVGRGAKFRGGRGPAGRPGGQGRPVGNGTRSAGFGRNASSRGPGQRNEFQRPQRGGHPPRHGKKHSK
jgi:hypothetical protein